jgi:hypothetical protein
VFDAALEGRVGLAHHDVKGPPTLMSLWKASILSELIIRFISTSQAYMDILKKDQLTIAQYILARNGDCRKISVDLIVHKIFIILNGSIWRVLHQNSGLFGDLDSEWTTASFVTQHSSNISVTFQMYSKFEVNFEIRESIEASCSVPKC